MQAVWEVLQAELPKLLLASLRVGIVFAALPAPFGATTPAQIRLACTLLVTFALCSALFGQNPGLPAAAPLALEPIAIARAALLELLVGAVIGMTVRVTLAAAEVAGSAIGQSIGLGFASTVDPTHGDTVLPTTELLGSLATLIFFAFDGHHALLAALATSFRSAPVGGELNALGYANVVQLASAMMARGLQISAPVVATMFIVQLGTALASRTAPRVNLFAFSFSILVAVGILVLWIAAPSLTVAIGAQVRRIPDALASLVGAG